MTNLAEGSWPNRLGLVVSQAALFAVVMPALAEAACPFPLIDVKNEMIEASVAQYAGSCPCPENADRAGRRCGRRSAWHRGGGQAPLCYPDDIPDELALAYCEMRYGQ